MKNETKRDVFDDALTYVPVGNEYDPVNDDEADDLRSFLSARYAAALPDDLPVIPKVVADWIEKCKHDGIAIASAMDERQLNKKVSDYFRTYYTRDQWIKLQDDFARAWLDGYQVEEDE